MLVYVTNCWWVGGEGGRGEIVIPMSEALRAADKKITKESKVVYGGALPGSASGCFKKATQTPNAGHPIWV
jgi:hypothetical protein